MRLVAAQANGCEHEELRHVAKVRHYQSAWPARVNSDTEPRHGGTLPHRTLWPQDGEEEHSIYQVGDIRSLLTLIRS